YLQINSIEIHINSTIHVLYLSIIFKNREGDLNIVAQISKLGVGQVYAASVMYLYFLKRIDQTFQLEKAMKILPGGSDEGETGIEQAGREGERMFYEETEETYQAGWFQQRNETVPVEDVRHIVITPQGIDSSKDEHIQISFKGPKRLLLEAVTFGSFLWDVESHVDSRYHFVLNDNRKFRALCVLYSFLKGHDQKFPVDCLIGYKFCKYWVSPFYRLLQRRSFGQGKRRVNKRTSLAQKEDVIKRTVYVSDIDQHRAFDEGCRDVIAKTVRFSQIKTAAREVVRFWRTFADGLMLKPLFQDRSSSQADQIMFKTAESMFPSADRSSKEEQENDRNRSVMV
ncbi:hypothetical protein HID58_038253, partial [Brassica napus]